MVAGFRSLTALVVAALLVVVIQAQTYQDTFKEGMTAYDQKRWADAVGLLQSAVSLQADTGQRIRLYGNRFEEYLPQFLIGRCLFELGSYAEAVRAFDQAERFGAIRRSGSYPQLQAMRRDAQSRLQATIATTSIPRAVPTPATIPPPPPPAGTTSTSVPPGLLREADDLMKQAEGARGQFESTTDLEILRTADPAFRALEEQAKATLALAREHYDSARQGNGNELSQASRTARLALAGYQRALQDVSRVKRAIVATLVTATGPFFDGQYGRARAELRKLPYTTGFPAAQAHLFQAAATYAEFLAGGKQDRRLRDDAETHARECRRLAGPAFIPDTRAFSPQFREFFRSVS